MLKILETSLNKQKYQDCALVIYKQPGSNLGLLKSELSQIYNKLSQSPNDISKIEEIQKDISPRLEYCFLIKHVIKNNKFPIAILGIIIQYL